MTPPRQRQLFLASLGLFILITLWHVLALPVALSYDSRIYLLMADALFTPGFPGNFMPNIRTPGVAALFRLGFELFGRQPLGIVAINTLVASAGVLTLAFTVRRVAGNLGAAAALLLLAFCPLLISYEHFALSEAGTFAYLALITALLCWHPNTRRRIWLKALGLALLLAAGYQHRPPLVELAPLVAILFACWHWPQKGMHQRRRAFILLALQLVLIVVLPQLSVRAYAPYVDNAAMTNMSIRQGIVRQAVVPPGDPRLGEDNEAYSAVLEKTAAMTGLMSGIPIVDIGRFTGHMFQAPGVMFRNEDAATLKTLLNFALAYPERTAAGMGRTYLLFMGLKGNQTTNLNSQLVVLASIDRGHNEVGEGPPLDNEAIVHNFEQKAGPTPFSRLLWALVRPYRDLQLVAAFVLVFAFFAGLVLRHLPLVTLTAMPLAFWAMHAVIMASEDRYGFPAMPISLVVLCALPGLLYRVWRARVKAPAESRPPQPGRPETV